MYCAVAVTILSGAIAERLRFKGYLLLTLIIAAIIYPLFGHWAWNGILDGAADGWLARLGFVDFAGATTVHSIGGWAALAALLIIGPRTGRFPEDEEPRRIVGTSIPTAAIGALLIFVSWFGMTGGRQLRFDDALSGILLNTLLGGVFGLLGALIVSRRHEGQPAAEDIISGCIAGLVAISAAVHVVPSIGAMFIGFVGGLIAVGGKWLLEQLRLDDPVGAIPTHLFAGIWGTLAVSLFGNLQLLDTGLNRPQQLAVQFLGIAMAAIWSFGLVWVVFTLVNRFMPLRVSMEAERLGLNISEHGTSTEIVDFLNVLDKQSQTGDLSLRVPVDKHSDIGRIAARYNRVMDRLEQAQDQSQALIKRALDGIITFAQDDQTILQMNPAAERIFRRHTDKTRGDAALRIA